MIKKRLMRFYHYWTKSVNNEIEEEAVSEEIASFGYKGFICTLLYLTEELFRVTILSLTII